MTIERDIEQAFERHSTDVEPTPGEWSALQQRVRRSHRVRVATFSTLGVAAVIAAAMVVPKLVDRPSAAPFINPGPGGAQSSPTAPPGVPDSLASMPPDKSVFRNDSIGYWVIVPSYLDLSIFEGVDEFRPQDSPSMASGKDTFAISISLQQGAYDVSAGQLGTASASKLGDMKAKRYESIEPAGPHQVTYRADATYIQCPPNAHCPHNDPSTLVVNVYASTAKLWDDQHKIAEDVIRTVERLAARTPPATLEVRTLLGSVATGIRFDALTIQLTKFLDERIVDGNAESYLSTNAKHQFDLHEGGLQLFDPLVPPNYQHYDYVGYRLESRVDADASSAEFKIKLIEGPSDGGSMGMINETLSIGSGQAWDGGKPNEVATVVRFATYEGCDKTWASCADLGER